MNSLSWFIYLTQVTDSLSVALFIFGVITLFLVGIAGIPAAIGKFDDVMGDGSFYDKSWRPFARKAVPAAILAILLSCLLPSRKTMLLIAGSEIGERTVKSQSAQDIINPGMDLLKSWIANETAKLKKSGGEK